MKRLDNKLDCKSCGAIYLDLPDDVTDDSEIHCSSCHDLLGTWGELQRDFYRQSREGLYYLHDGQIDALTSAEVRNMDQTATPTDNGGETTNAAIKKN